MAHVGKTRPMKILLIAVPETIIGRGTLSFITELELLSFSKISPESEETIKGLLKNCQIVDINPEVKDLTIEFRHKSKLKLPDSIVSATAYSLNYPY